MKRSKELVDTPAQRRHSQANRQTSSQTHSSFLRQVLLNADPDSLQGGLPVLRSLVQLTLQPLDVLQAAPTTSVTRGQANAANLSQSESTHGQQFGDGVRLGVADAAVARPHDPPFAVGDGVRLLRAVQLHRRHPPVVTGPRGQGLIREEVPFAQAGDADGGLQDHLLNKDFGQNTEKESSPHA